MIANIFLQLLIKWNIQKLIIQMNHREENINAQEEQIRKLKQQYLSQDRQVFGESLFSLIFSTWITPLFQIGSHVDIDSTLIPKLKKTDTNEVNFIKFQRIFLEQSQKRSIYPRITLIKSITEFYKKEIVIFFVLCLILVGLQIYIPILSYQIVEYIEGQRNTKDSIKYFLMFAFLYLIQIMLNHLFFFINVIKGTSLTNIFSLMIYKKILRYPIIASKQFSISKIINFSQVDAYRFQYLGFFLKEVLCSLLLITLNLLLLYYYIGFSFLVGVGLLILFAGLSFLFFNSLIRMTQKLSQANDQRIKVAEEIIQIIKFIKVNALQEYFLRKIESKRQVQLSIRMKIILINAVNKFFHFRSSPIMVICSISVYLWLGNDISTSKAFLIIMIYGNIQMTLKNLPDYISELIKAWISAQRIEEFLLAEQINQTIIQQQKENAKEQFAIEIREGNFVWEKLSENQYEDYQSKNYELANEVEIDIQNVFQPNKKEKIRQNIQMQELLIQGRNYVNVLKDINIKIRSRQLTMIIGDIGSGKSTLIYDILNQTLVLPGKNSKIKRVGSIAYCSQKPWIMSGTVKDNIVFFNEYNQQKLRQALYYSCMEQDLKTLSQGILTQIGEKGVNLSGGQKARISLARALYSNNDIFIFDDVLSALDVHVSKFIMEKTIKGFLKEKTIVLITHALQFLNQADNVILVLNGKIDIKKSTQFENIQKKIETKEIEQKEQNEKFPVYMERKFEESSNKRQSQNLQPSNQNSLIKQLTLPEEQDVDEISPEVYEKFFQLVGGYFFAGGVLLMMIFWIIFSTSSNIQIEQWCQDTENPLVYLYLYIGFALQASLFIGISSLIMMYGEMRKSRIIHTSVMKSLIYTNYIEFFTRVPKGRILNRLSDDLGQMDQIVTLFLQPSIVIGFSILSTFVICIYSSSPFALIPIIIATVSSVLIFRQYIKSQRSLVRLQKIYYSPVLSGITELISGVDVIRAYKKNKEFMQSQIKKMDSSKAVSMTRLGIEYWFFTRISAISLILNYSVFAYCLFSPSQNGPKMGLFLTYIMLFLEEIIYLLYNFIHFRVKMVSAQRLVHLTNLQPQQGYTDIGNKQIHTFNNFNFEKKSKQAIRFINFSARYRQGLPLILKNINLSIHAGRKVGIVGRTGAGKSSFINCLLRIIEPANGQLIINNKQIREYDIRQLRSSFTMIEQDPTLISATFRENLDPANSYTDSEINEMLRRCNILKMVEEKGGLDSMLSNNSISIGQKQLVCICRALLKKSSIVLIDEATANIDTENDKLVQQVIKDIFKQSTVLIIAHRLSTLKDCSQILVLKEGEIQEWGSMTDLLKKPGGIFRKMWETQDNSYIQ